MDKHYDRVAIFQQFIYMHDERLKMPLRGHLLSLCEFEEDYIKSEYDKSAKKGSNRLKKYRETFEQRFLEAYQSQTILEKLDMYIRMVKYLVELLSNNESPDNLIGQMSFDDAYTRSYNLKIWKKKFIRLDFNKCQLFAIKEDKVKVYDLKNYLIRESNNSEYYGFVLESINNQPPEKLRIVRVGFRSMIIFQDWFVAVKGALVKAENLKLKQQFMVLSRLSSDLKANLVKQNSQQKVGSQPQIINRPRFDQSVGQDQGNASFESDTSIKTIVKTLMSNNSEMMEMVEEMEAVSQDYKMHINLFEQILPNYRLESLTDQNMHELVLKGQAGSIWRHNQHKNRYKVFVPLKERSLDKIFAVISEVENYSQWNAAVEEASVKNMISSENVVVIYHKNKAYSSLYRPRDFVYLRHVFRKNNNLYMVDKSIVNQTFPSYITVVRGSMECIWGLVYKGLDCTLVVDIQMDNQGYNNESQNHNLAMTYMKGLLSIQDRINTVVYTEKKSKVLDLEWGLNLRMSSENLLKKRQNVTRSVPVTPLKKITSRTIHQAPAHLKVPPKTSQQRRKTIHQEMANSSIHKSRVEDVKVGRITIQYQFDSDGMVIIPQDYLQARFVLKPSSPQTLFLQEVVNGHAIWKGEWKFDKDGGIIFINQAKINSQKGVLKFIVGQIAKNIVTGKSVLGISLPVDIFACESNLERFAFSMTYAPILLEKAFKLKSPLERFKWVTAYGITNSILYLNMEKPFNPILGQTFQGWINGCPIYLEQISHHPPIASFWFQGRGYKMTGSLESKVELQVNSGCGRTQGVYRIITDDGSDFNFITPGGQICGITYGDRHFNLVGKYYVWSKRHLFFLEVSMDASNKGFFSKRQHPTDYMQGNILEVTRQFIEDFQLMKKKEKPGKAKIVNERGKVTGLWNKILMVDGQTYLDLDTQVACKLQYDDHLLASDGNFREDLAYKRAGNNARSQTQKQRLQVAQRNDKKLRQKHGGRKH